MSDVGVVKIENRGKNLIDAVYYGSVRETTGETLLQNQEYSPNYAIGSYQTQWHEVFTQPIYVIAGKTYTVSFEIVFNQIGYILLRIFESDTENFINGNAIIAKYIYDSVVTYTFTPSKKWIKIAMASGTGTVIFKNIQLEEGASATPYEPPLENYIDFNQELFGYNGVFDTLTDDGTLIKRWNKEIGITVSSGSCTLAKSGTGTAILVNEINGEVYEGTVSGTSLSTSAPDGTYTVIYQLATPEISTVSFSGSGLILDKGDNNIILPDYGVMELEYEGTGTSQESLIYMQDLRIREEASYREYQPVNSKYTKSIQTGKRYSISIGQVYFERSMADKLDKETRFTLEVIKQNEDGRTETDRYVNCRLDSVEETDSNGLRMESVSITAEAKEVVA